LKPFNYTRYNMIKEPTQTKFFIPTTIEKFDATAEPTIEGIAGKDYLGNALADTDQAINAMDGHPRRTVQANSDGAATIFRIDAEMTVREKIDFMLLDGHNIRDAFAAAVKEQADIHHHSADVFGSATRISPAKSFGGHLGKKRPYLDLDGIDDYLNNSNTEVIDIFNNDREFSAEILFAPKDLGINDYYLVLNTIFEEAQNYARINPDSTLQVDALPVSAEFWVMFGTNDINRRAEIFCNNWDGVGYRGAWFVKETTNLFSCNYGSGIGFGSTSRKTKIGTTHFNCNGITLYHIVCVMQGPANMQIYINGADDGGAYSGNGGAMVPGQGYCTIGRMATATHRYAYTHFRSVGFWNVALTAADALKLYNDGLPADLTRADSYDVDKTAGLQGYWKISGTEVNGSILMDSSVNANHATLVVTDPDQVSWTEAEFTNDGAHLFTIRRSSAKYFHVFLDPNGSLCWRDKGHGNFRHRMPTAEFTDLTKVYHLMITKVDGAQPAIYIDGVLQSFTPEAQVCDQDPTDPGTTIGRGISIALVYSKMLFYGFRLFNYELLITEIESLYNGGQPLANLLPAIDRWGSGDLLADNQATSDRKTEGNTVAAWTGNNANLTSIVGNGDGSPKEGTKFMKIAMTASPAQARQSFPTVIGLSYTITAWLKDTDTAVGAMTLRVGTSAGDNNIIESDAVTPQDTWVKKELIFSAISTTTHISIQKVSSGIDDTYADWVYAITKGCTIEYHPDGLKSEDNKIYDSGTNSLDATVTQALFRLTPSATEKEFTLFTFAEVDEKFWFMEFNNDAVTGRAGKNTLIGQIVLGRIFTFNGFTPEGGYAGEYGYPGVMIEESDAGIIQAEMRYGLRPSWELVFTISSKAQFEDLQEMIDVVQNGLFPFYVCFDYNGMHPVFWRVRIQGGLKYKYKYGPNSPWLPSISLIADI